MPYTVSIDLLVDGTEHDSKEASVIANRLQSALDGLNDSGVYELIEYSLSVEDEALGISVAASHTEEPHDA